MKYADNHCHHVDLQEPVDPNPVWYQQAREDGVAVFACNAATPSEWPLILKFAEQCSGVIPCLGIHPWYVNDQSEDHVDELEQRLQQQPFGIGEIGLDWSDTTDRKLQIKVFRQQLKLASKYHLPVSIHCVRAWKPLFECLDEVEPLGISWMVHGFASSLEIAEQIFQRGGWVSLGSGILDPSRRKLLALVEKISLDHLLAETDAPNHANVAEFEIVPGFPPPRTKANKPRDIQSIDLVEVHGILTYTKGIPMGELSARIWANSQQFWGDLWPEAVAKP